jgi:membrane protease YdiL (CAAX protease family)
MATDFDPYRILEVDRTAGQDEIDAAYRRQWAAYPSDPSPEQRLREIQTAYRILSDSTERAAYDSRLAGRADGVAPVPETGGIGELAAPAEAVRSAWGVREVLKGIGILVAAAFVGAMVFGAIAIGIAGGTDEVETNGDALAVQLLASIVFQAAAVYAAWRFSVRKFHLRWDALGLRMPERGLPWLPFSLVGGAFVLVIAYGAFLSAIGVEPDTDLPDAAYDNALPLVIIVVLTVAVAPFVEEVFFRGFVFPGLARRIGTAWGAIGCGVLFGIAHLGNPGYFYVVPPIIAIGALFAYGYYYSKSILPSIAAHFMFNLIQIVGAIATR